MIRIRPAGPAGHRLSRSARSARSSMTSAHGRLVWASQETKRAAATSAPSPGWLASTVLAACAKPVRTASALVAVTQTRTSTSRPFHMAWVNSTASWVLPVPPWPAGADLGLLAVHQHAVCSWVQAGGQVRAGFGARVIGVSQRRHDPGQQDPRLRRRSGLLSDHVRQPLLPAPQSALAGPGVPGRTCRAARHISHDNKDHRGTVIYRDKSNYGVIASNRAYLGTACRSSCWPSLAISGRPPGRNGSNGMLMTDTRPRARAGLALTK